MRWTSVGLGLVLAGTLGALASGPWVVLVTSSQGEVRATGSDGQSFRVHALCRLSVHDRLAVGDGATLSMTVLPGGEHVTVTGPQTVEVSADGVSTQKKEVLEGRTYPGTLVGDSQPWATTPSKAPLLAFPGSPVLHLEYLAGSDIRQLQLHIRNANDERCIVDLPGDKARVTLNDALLSRYNEGPGAPLVLKRGARYMVDITATPKAGYPTGAAYVVYLQSPEEAEALGRALLDARKDVASHPEDTTAYALAGALYEEHRCYDSAMEELGSLARRDVDNADYLGQLQDAVSRDLENTQAPAIDAHDDDAFDKPF